MKITKAQRWKILELWGKVCQDRGWKVSDRALRLATIGGILQRQLTTLDDVGRLDECTKVMAELGCMIGDDLRAGLEATDPTRNHKRNWRWLIPNEVLPCLALYPLEKPMGLDGARQFFKTVMESKTRYRKADRPESDPTLNDFDERTVEQIFWTLSARLNDKRKAAGHSGHAMCVLAGVRCKCASCRGATATAETMAESVPALELDEQADAAEALKSEDPDCTV